MTNAEKILREVRDSEELGIGSCSIYDECYDDEELLEEIEEFIEMEETDDVETIFQECLKAEKRRVENEREIAIGYGGWC